MVKSWKFVPGDFAYVHASSAYCIIGMRHGQHISHVCLFLSVQAILPKSGALAPPSDNRYVTWEQEDDLPTAIPEDHLLSVFAV